MIFVSSPYSSADPTIKKQRRNATAQYCIQLAKEGHAAISPVVYGLALMEETGTEMPDDFDTWKSFCLSLLKGANIVHVLRLQGWTQSSGVKAEIEYALDLGIDIKYVDFV